MLFAGIMAGGSGRRMQAGGPPKQLLMLGAKPVFIHTLEIFLALDEIDRILIGIHPSWRDTFEKLLAEYLPGPLRERLILVEGSGERSETLLNVLEKIEELYGRDPAHLIVTHDAVRPFVTPELIRATLAACREYDVASCAIPSSDSLLFSEDGHEVDAVLDRRRYFRAQTPQTFAVSRYLQLASDLTVEEKERLTDACALFALKGGRIGIVPGDAGNIKITLPGDLEFAEILLRESSRA